MTSLGTGTSTARGPSRDDLVFRSDVEAMVNRLMADVEKRLTQAINGRLRQPADPVVNVTTPTPIVNISPPDVVVPSPAFSPIIEVETEGMDDLAREITGLRSDVQALTMILSKPITRTIERDTDDLIVRVVEHRG